MNFSQTPGQGQPVWYSGESYQDKLERYRVRDFKLQGYVFECLDCRALVSDYEQHSDWHKDQDDKITSGMFL